MSLKMYGEKNLNKIQNIIGVLGGKGGVGKSTVTVNLALALKKQGRRVGILDADVYGPSICHLLGNESLPRQVGTEVVPAEMKGLSVMSVAFFQKEKEASVVRAPIANQIIHQFLNEIDWGDLDDLLIDFPPGTGDIQITLMQKARMDGVVIVTTPQEVALLDVRKSMQMCHQMGVPIFGVVENMSYFIHKDERHALFGEGGGKLLADECDAPLLGQIPIDTEISRTGDEGLSLFETDAISCLSFEEVSTRLMSKLEVLKKTDSKKSQKEWDWNHDCDS